MTWSSLPCRKEASEKEEELKALVGARYHNLMDSVDDAVSMYQCTEKLHALFQELHKVSGKMGVSLAQRRHCAAPLLQITPLFLIAGTVMRIMQCCGRGLRTRCRQ